MPPVDSATAAASPHSTAPTRLIAIGWALASSACLSNLWVIVRTLNDRHHPFEITFFASLFSLLLFLPWLLKVGRSALYTKRIGRHFIRACFNSIGIMAWFWALTLMPLADAAALGLMSPLAATIAAMIFLGENVRLRRWLALGFGAAGALVIIRPGFQEVGLGVWLIVTMAVFSAFQRTLAKTLTRTEGSATSVVYLMLFQAPIALAVALPFWVAPLPGEWPLLVASGILLGGAHYCFMQSVQLADVSALEPYNFVRLIFAAVLGFFIFSEIPDLWTWIGGGMIIMSTSYLARREAALRAQGRSASVPPTVE